MKPFYNTIAITFVVFWGVIFYNTNIGTWVHLFLVPIVIVLIYNFIEVIKLLNRS